MRRPRPLQLIVRRRAQERSLVSHGIVRQQPSVDSVQSPPAPRVYEMHPRSRGTSWGTKLRHTTDLRGAVAATETTRMWLSSWLVRIWDQTSWISRFRASDEDASLLYSNHVCRSVPGPRVVVMATTSICLPDPRVSRSSVGTPWPHPIAAAHTAMRRGLIPPARASGVRRTRIEQICLTRRLGFRRMDSCGRKSSSCWALGVMVAPARGMRKAVLSRSA